MSSINKYHKQIIYRHFPLDPGFRAAVSKTVNRWLRGDTLHKTVLSQFSIDYWQAPDRLKYCQMLVELFPLEIRIENILNDMGI